MSHHPVLHGRKEARRTEHDTLVLGAVYGSKSKRISNLYLSYLRNGGFRFSNHSLGPTEAYLSPKYKIKSQKIGGVRDDRRGQTPIGLSGSN